MRRARCCTSCTPIPGQRAGPVSMPCFFWYLTLHFTRSVAMCQLYSDIFANDISHTGNTCSRSLPITPTYSSRPSTNCSTIAGVPMCRG